MLVFDNYCCSLLGSQKPSVHLKAGSLYNSSLNTYSIWWAVTIYQQAILRGWNLYSCQPVGFRISICCISFLPALVIFYAIAHITWITFAEQMQDISCNIARKLCILSEARHETWVECNFSLHAFIPFWNSWIPANKSLQHWLDMANRLLIFILCKNKVSLAQPIYFLKVK